MKQPHRTEKPVPQPKIDRDIAVQITHISMFCIYGWAHVRGRPINSLDLTIDGTTLVPKFMRTHVDGLEIHGAQYGDLHGFKITIPTVMDWSNEKTHITVTVAESSKAAKSDAVITQDDVIGWFEEALNSSTEQSGMRQFDQLLAESHAQSISCNSNASKRLKHVFQRGVVLNRAEKDTLDLPRGNSDIYDYSAHKTAHQIFNAKKSALKRNLCWTDVCEMASIHSLPTFEFQDAYIIDASIEDARSAVHLFCYINISESNWSILHDTLVDVLRKNYTEASDRLTNFNSADQFVPATLLSRVCEVITYDIEKTYSAQNDDPILVLIYRFLDVLQEVAEFGRDGVEDRRLVRACIALLSACTAFEHWLFNDVRQRLLIVYAFSETFWRACDAHPAHLDLPSDHRQFFETTKTALACGERSDNIAATLLSVATSFTNNGYINANRVMSLLLNRALQNCQNTELTATLLASVRNVAYASSWGYVAKQLYSPNVDIMVKTSLLNNFDLEIKNFVSMSSLGDLQAVYNDFKNAVAAQQTIFDGAAKGRDATEEQIKHAVQLFDRGLQHPNRQRFFASLAAELSAFAYSTSFPGIVSLAVRVLNIVARRVSNDSIYGQSYKDLSLVVNFIIINAPTKGVKHNKLYDLIVACHAVRRNTLRPHEDSGIDMPGDLERLVNSKNRVVIVIYSCIAYLKTRAKHAFNTWGQKFIELGYDVVVVTGDGPKIFEEHNPLMGVSDNYEDLPDKTLALMKWFVESDYDYIYKVDDDCAPIPDTFEAVQLYRSGDYLGRILYVDEENFDRSWHKTKSKTLYAQNTIDLSPTPSVYADGGTGYFLSRYAAVSLLDAAKGGDRDLLTHVSFMEDKLVGDLLAQNNIKPVDTAYVSHIARRNADGQPAVTSISNHGFDDNISCVSIIHTDTDHKYWPKNACKERFDPAPLRIFPAQKPLKFGYDSGGLEFMKNDAPIDVPVAVFACIRNERHILEIFFDFYRSKGINSFYIVDNLSTDGSLQFIMEQPDTTVFSVDSEYKNSRYGVDWQEALLQQYGLGRWCLIVDADEFVEPLPGYNDFASLGALADDAGADAFRVIMCDVYPKEPLSEVSLSDVAGVERIRYTDDPPVRPWALSTGYFNNGPDFKSSVRHRVTGPVDPNLYTAVKCCFVRFSPYTKLTAGIHDVGGINTYNHYLALRHLKFHRHFMTKVAEEVQRKQHFDGASEYLNYKERIARFGDEFYFEGSVDVSTREELYRVVNLATKIEK